MTSYFVTAIAQRLGNSPDAMDTVRARLGDPKLAAIKQKAPELYDVLTGEASP